MAPALRSRGELCPALDQRRVLIDDEGRADRSDFGLRRCPRHHTENRTQTEQIAAIRAQVHMISQVGRSPSPDPF